MSLINCPDCGTNVSDSAYTCPKCNANIRGYVAAQIEEEQKRIKRTGCFWLVLLFIAGVFIAKTCGSSSNSDDSRNTTRSNENQNQIETQMTNDEEVNNHYDQTYSKNDEFDLEETEERNNSGESFTLQNAIEIAEMKFSQYLPKILESHSSLDLEAIVDTQTTYTGDFTGDGIEDIAIYFYLVPHEGGNMCLGQGVSLYQNTGDDVNIIAGFDPDYSFSFKKISNGLIYIDKLEYTEDDALCCPSIRVEHALTIVGNKAF